MDSERFIRATLASAAALAAAIAGVNVRVDPYGIFHDARGEERAVVRDERWSKYLYTFNYIPANFDGVLIGSSVSENLDTSRIRGHRVYNACLGGGNSTEESALVESILDHGGHLRLVLVSLDFFLLHDIGGRQAGGMQPRDYWSALGSVQLLEDYAVGAAVHAGLLPARWSPYGVQSYEASGMARADADAIAADVLKLPIEKRVATADEVAIRRLDALFKRVRTTGARLVGYFPPVYERRRANLSYAELERAARALFEPGETIVDFNDGTHRALTADAGKYIDGIHLTAAAAGEVVDTLSDALAEGR